MIRLLKMELSRAFRNRLYYAVLAVGIVLALLSAIPGIQTHFDMIPKQLSPTSWGPTNWDSCYAFWMSVHNVVPFEGLFYQLVLLLAAIPYACSMRQELEFGYANQVFSRVSRVKYFVAKYIAAFISGGLVALIPSTINLIVLACFVPTYTPSIENVIYTGVYTSALWSEIFYTNPLLYCVLYSAIAFCMCGLWAVAVLGLSFLIRNRVALISGTYLAAILSDFISDRLYLIASGVAHPEFGLPQLIRAFERDATHSLTIVGIWMLLLLILSLVPSLLKLKRDVL
ncbi:ABC transporter permease [Atopobium sp. oral taxon 810]|uniref:ABC transporter permease n=1 Tax=Atopobium sp. oral taxon 810 TaxID=712158 RepID=UPI0003963F89|nr:ABC transporter permease [Atopobium sp. oral taxon 810]ERI06101.1 hypothetical protein HMPREF9069_00442 [Atopobium sp. oral taxon 810 str. F0209]